eukprot:gene2067-4041_t
MVLDKGSCFQSKLSMIILSLMLLIIHQTTGLLQSHNSYKKLSTRLSMTQELSSSSLLSVDDILSMVSSDSTKNTPSTQKIISEWINAKGEIYRKDHPESTTLDDSNIFGNYDVAYVNPAVNNPGGNPAGGGYRSSLGRIFYQLDGIYQHILPSDGITVINYIRGRLLGLFTLSVILKGKAQQISETDRERLSKTYNSNLSKASVSAIFEPPVLGLALRLFSKSRADDKILMTLRIGPTSNVVLDTPHVCDKVRLGRGSRGSDFIFKRTVDPSAEIYKSILNKKPLSAKKIGTLLLTIGTGSLAYGLRHCRVVLPLCIDKLPIAIGAPIFLAVFPMDFNFIALPAFPMDFYNEGKADIV